MRKHGLSMTDIQEKLPCSLDIFNAYQVNYTGNDTEGQLYIKGKNKLISEIKHAVTIPEYDRRLISQAYLAIQ